MEELRIANWNVEWRNPSGRDAVEIRRRLLTFRPDIVCLTECWLDMLADWGGYTITSRIRPDKHPSKRSVALWSRSPWKEPDDIGHAELSRRCFIAGSTSSPVGEVRVAGVIIPYHMADVAHGTRDRRMWEQHEIFLDYLPKALSGMGSNSIVLGDFNQRIPSTFVPKRLQSKLRDAFADYDIVTAADIPGAPNLPIDHIALGSALESKVCEFLSNERADGKQLSDHFGVTVTACKN